MPRGYRQGTVKVQERCKEYEGLMKREIRTDTERRKDGAERAQG